MFMGVPYIPFFMAAGGCFLLAVYTNFLYLLLLPVVIFVISPRAPIMSLVALLAALLILIQHRTNMGRLLSGIEPRFRAGHGAR